MVYLANEEESLFLSAISGGELLLCSSILDKVLSSKASLRIANIMPRQFCAWYMACEMKALCKANVFT